MTSDGCGLILAAMRIYFLAILLLLAPPALAANCRGPEGLPEPQGTPTPRPNSFYRSEAGLACVLDAQAGQAMAEHNRPTSFLPCLKVGAVAIADTQTQVEELLGPPGTVREMDERTEARAYVIAQPGQPRPYYVVTYRERVAVAVQLMGPPTDMPSTFAGLSLGDPAQAVVDALGKPVQRCVLKANGPETWLWPAFPIGIDMANDRVVGMKATWPVGRPIP